LYLLANTEVFDNLYVDRNDYIHTDNKKMDETYLADIQDKCTTLYEMLIEHIDRFDIDADGLEGEESDEEEQ